MKVLMVRKSGPVQTMKLGAWFWGAIIILLLAVIGGLAAGGYFYLRQERTLAEVRDSVELLMLRAERLEYLVQEQETREIIAQEQQNAVAVEGAGGSSEAVAPKARVTPMPTPTATPQATPTPQAEADIVGIARVEQDLSGNELVVRYDVTNENTQSQKAEGYVFVLLYTTEGESARLESSPPMRLDDDGRPVNYRRGTPFAINRFRRITAKFDVGEKQLDHLEFVVYSRRGQLLLVKQTPISVERPAPDEEAQPSPTENRE